MPRTFGTRRRRAVAFALAVAVVLEPAAASAARPDSPPEAWTATPATVAVDPAGGPKTVDELYRYLENPELTGEGQQPPHSDLRPYADARAAVADLTDRTARNPHVLPLNGEWRLKIHERPQDVPAAFRTDGFDASGWPVATVPHTWQSNFIDHPMFRNIPEEFPDDPPRVPRDLNPTGAYVRTIDLPADWDGDRVFLRFEGVTSAYLVWVNGGYVGYDQGGYTPAEFDVTERLRPGRNQIAVQVHRWSSGSYLEDVDQWRYSGIFRDVWLYRTAQTRLQDAYLTTDLDAAYRDATLTARVDVAGAPGEFAVRATLLDPRNRAVTTARQPAGTGRVTLTMPVTAPATWSAEEPTLYALVLELLGPGGTVLHTTAQPVGFREIEVRDRQILVNGERILIKGTNRAETDPDTGRYNTPRRQRDDVFLMKRLHLNAVRTSHYPSDPYLYRLADRYGLWVDDEVDIETHSRENCPSNCLADRPEWQAAFADRFQAMVARDKNHPSVIFWDTGNEAGLGAAHYAMAAWADANEPTRLLYHQSNNPDGDAPFADVDGPRYPTPARLENRVNASTKPVVMGEYAHAMGNGLGNFDQFWALARRNPQMQGGFIWDWADQNLRQPLILTPDSSANRIQTFLVGKPEPVAGRRGQAVSLSGLDDFVDVFRDRRLDLTGPLTLDAWVHPGEWSGSFPILTKGQGYALQLRDADTLEFGVDAGGWATVTADVPAGWYGAWHRVSGVYDGAALRLYIDGAEVAAVPRTGAVDPGLFEVNLGRNAETQQDNDLWSVRLGRGLIDDARIYGRALTPAELAGDPAERAVLALNFDTYQPKGDFLSLGISLSGTDGLVGSDRYVQPETAEMAWAQAPIRFTAVDAARGRVRVHNEQQAGAYELRLDWNVAEQARTLRSGSRTLRLKPGETVELDLGAPPPNPGDRERLLNLTAVTTRDLPWARRGWTVGYDQFSVGGRAVPGILPAPARGAPALATRGDTLTVSGPGFAYRFESGALTSMRADGRELIAGPPTLDVYRPPTSNETYDWGTDDRRIWHELGLDRLRTTIDDVRTRTEADAVVVEVRSTVAGTGISFDQTMRYRVDRNGTITLTQNVAATGGRVGELPYLPRVGVSLRLPDEMQSFAYYGRGPHESYNDRRSGARLGVYRSTVEREYVRYSRPQAYGNHTDTRWASLHDGRAGLLVGGARDVSVTPYDDLDRAEYDHQLPLVRNRDWVTLHAEAGETGMGETPNSVLDPFKLSPAEPYSHELVLRPLTRDEIRAGGVPDSDVAAPCAPDVTATTDGRVTAGTPERVDVTVSPRCAGGLTSAAVDLAVPPGWTVEPARADLGPVATGGPETATFTVTPPADTDVGRYDLTASVTSGTAAGYRTTVTAAAAVEAPLPAGYAWLSDRPYVEQANGWGPVERDRSNGEQGATDGNPMTIGGVRYEKGLGAHAYSSVLVDLGGTCTRFRSDVGVDDEASGSVEFEVWADGTLRARSGVVTGAAAAVRLDVDITGARQLDLRVTDAGNGNGSDHADWAAARLACA
ncbi:glycoside hydrolase family 2 TIM barrel-domain containing protein [Catenuloplanes atrovinosus]|uniref:beta-galactosidase n=1 Tax=Catenuloplanes atrovinosus TaxID=137266 RepID=A0AAE3YNF7_9ACTN|nr:glycoside hydrolase family 2 TIM barrel-domain containing protein [Catenuloplanes atrovinosus]MDR7275732.1 beta-galactosidase [Catenuloplanes atrovinosus]